MSVPQFRLAQSAGCRRLLKATAIGFGVVVLGTASLGQASAQNVDIFGDDWPFPVGGRIVVGDSPVPGAISGGSGGNINVGGNSGGSVMIGGSSGGISIGGGSSSSGGGGGSGNSAG